MLKVFVYALISLHPFKLCASEAAPSPVQKNSPWLCGCVDASSGLFSPTALRDLDPVSCAVYCLDEGVQAEKDFVVKVSGSLAGRPGQPAEPSPPILVISVLHGPLGVPSCIPFLLKDSNFETVDVAYLGDPVTLQAHTGDGTDVQVSWRFTHKGKTQNTECVQTICCSACQNNTLVVARPAFSDLRLGASGRQRISAVQIYAPKQAYPTNTVVTFLAVTKAPGPLEFLWHFGDSRSSRTTSRTITKIYHKPGRYDVVTVMSGNQTSWTSDVYPLVVQRAVRLNRLRHQPSVMLNQTVTFSCRVNEGTDVNFLWFFGDGSSEQGQSIEPHVFHRMGEFTVTVTVSNRVSSASLSSHIFVVDRPCWPPPVKNMGPLKLQVRRHESVRLGVTYESEVDCDVSGGLSYTWTLFDSAGSVFPLTLIDTNRQSLILPAHHLHYDTYTAVAKVQVVDTVVYSNYSVRVQVIPSPPVAFIQGGTNIFINNRNSTVIILDGRRSHDPDFPASPLSFNWTCKPVSSIRSSCFHHDVQTSSSVLAFPASFLKDNFDQFRFTLGIRSLQRSAASEAYLTLTSDATGKLLVDCPQCQGDRVSWEQPLSISASCEGCDVEPRYIQYSWSLYLVNASSKPVTEVPSCYTVDIPAPSSILEGPGTSSRTPANSSQRHFAADASPPNPPVYTSAPVSEDEKESGTNTKLQNPSVTDGGTSAENSGKKSAMASLTEPDPSSISSLVRVKRAATGGEPFYHPLGDFDPPESLYSPTEYQPFALDNSSVLYPSLSSQSHVIGEFPVDLDSSGDWEHSLPVWEGGDSGGQPDWDYDISAKRPEEGEPGISAGRSIGVEGDALSPVDDLNPTLHEDKGSNLVDSRPSVVIQEPILLDLSRDLVDPGLFESYTHAGISSPLLSFKPNSLTSGSRYMLEVRAESHKGLLGRTQLFLKTDPVPKGVTCQVQPMRGRELYTHFSIFCSSGKEDLLYEYSIRVGDGSPRILYQGRDFQYYFNLPSGDPTDDHKVTVYSKIRSSVYGTTTKPCPVTVQVQPSFFRDTSSSSSSSSGHHDPDLELSESGLKNLSALVQLGNDMEVRNYISLLSSILNRLSTDTKANTRMQSLTRNALICTMCELEGGEQASMLDNICLLRSLLQVTNQVSLVSAGQVTRHVQAISDRFSKSGDPVLYNLDQKVLDTLVALLSHSLQAAVTDFTPEALDIKQEFKSSSHEENIGKVLKPSIGCIPQSPSGIYFNSGGSNTANWMVLLVGDILQAAADLILKYASYTEAKEHRVSTGFIALYAAYQNHTSTVITSGSTSIYMTASVFQQLFDRHGRETGRPHGLCALSLLTELTHSPYTWAHDHRRLTGPVVDLSLYECSTRRRIPVRSLVQPIKFNLQQPAGSTSSVHQYILHCSQVSYHSFDITQEHLQQAIKLSVAFTPPLKKLFPIMLLFRMFKRPTPKMHHLRKIYHWEGNTTHFILPSSYLNAPGVGHLALLHADFEKVPRCKRTSERVSYSLTVDSSLCLSWDGHRGVWTHRGCRTWQEDTADAVGCSCRRLRPLTVVRRRIHSSHESTSLDPLLSVSSDPTVLCVLVLCMCLYVPGLVACRRADVISEENQRVHYLSDNSPRDPYLYAVTIHTGPCSAAHMSAKVYLSLSGEDGVSQTKELQVPGCTLFRRNSQHTFIFSAAESLGPLWGVHIWHDNSGPSPFWYLIQVKVSEVSRRGTKGCVWLFLAQCWLAVNRGDGQVERMLQVCTQGIGFSKMLRLKLSDYLSDYHLWISVHRCPCPSSFTHTQRLSVILLLLFGYACVNTAIISRMDHLLPFDLGVIDASAVSVTTGVLSALAVLPAAAIISFLFRLRDVKLTGSGFQQVKGNVTENVLSEATLSVTGSTSEPPQEVWRRKFQDTDSQSLSSTLQENKDTDGDVIPTDVVITKEDSLTVGNNRRPPLQNLALIPGSRNDQAPPDLLRIQNGLLSSTWNDEHVIHSQGRQREDSHHKAVRPSFSSVTDRPLPRWSHYLAWTLWLLLSLSCLMLSAGLGMRFNTSQVLLWLHSFFFSLISCIFLIQPAVIITGAAIVSFWYRQKTDVHIFSSIRGFETETSQLRNHNDVSRSECSNLEKLLGVRHRARYLRLVRPPTPTELKKIRKKKIREAFLYKALRDLSICLSMLFLMLCINYGSSLTDHYHLSRAIKKEFIRGHDDAFMSIRKHEDWWKWAESILLSLLYKNASAATTQSYILIGQPILWKTEVSGTSGGQLSSVAFLPEGLRLFLSGSRAFLHPQSDVRASLTEHPKTCGRLDCYLGPSAMIGFGYTKAEAASKLRRLHSSGWLGRQTAAVAVRLTLFSPAPSLFTSLTMLTEQSFTGALMCSARVQSVRVHHVPGVWGYLVVVCQLLFLLLSLLHLCDQVSAVVQQGLVGYWRTSCTWLEVSCLSATSVYCICCIYHSSATVKLAEELQRRSRGSNVDVSLLATWEQHVRTLRGVLLFLLIMKSAVALRVNRTMAAAASLLTHTLSSFLCPTISGLVLLAAMSCMINLLILRSCSRLGSLQTPLCLHWGPAAERGPHSTWSDISRVLHLSSTLVWTAVVIGVTSSLVRGVKKSQRRGNVFTVTQFIVHVRQRVSVLIRQRKKAWIENHVERKTYYFEEFENLMDELLFRLNALSDTLHHTLPPKDHHSSGTTPMEPSKVEAPDFIRTQIVQELRDRRDASDHGDGLPACHPIQYKSELEVLRQKGRREDDSSQDTVVASDKTQLKTNDQQHQNNREFRSDLKTQSHLSLPESASLLTVWTEDVPAKRYDRCAKRNDNCKLVKSQAKHSEVVVEVLVHRDEFSVESVKQ